MQNADNISKFLGAIPQESCSKFLAMTISSDEFINAFTQQSAESAEFCVKVEHDGASTKPPIAATDKERYAAFVAEQEKTAEEAYAQHKRAYAAKNRFRKVNLPPFALQTFTTEFQVTSAPRLHDQPIDRVILLKDDRGDTPIACQKTRKKVVKAIKPEIHTCKISQILTANDEGNYDVASNALSSQTILKGIK
jgi:hypothetical protein